MNDELAKVFNGFLALKESEKREFIEHIKEYEKFPFTTEKNLRKSINENFDSHGITLGPSPNSCPCCGK